MESKIWSRNRPLFLYGNEEKLNDLLGRIYHSVIVGYQTQKKQTVGLGTKATAGLGKILSSLGLPTLNVEINSNIGIESLKTEISSITFDTKLSILFSYCSEKEKCPYYNTHDGLVLERDSKSFVKDWKSRPISDLDKKDKIGHILGIFSAQRISPPAPTNILLGEELSKYQRNELFNKLERPRTGISEDFFGNINSLWLFTNVKEAKIGAEIPMLIKNIRPVSQTALVAFCMQKEYKLEAFGLLSWNNNVVTCDPVTWSLFI